jgi:hypothetical protein
LAVEQEVYFAPMYGSACTLMTASAEHLAPSVWRALRFLRNNQLPHGEFRTYASPSVALRRTCLDGSVFATTFVLHSIEYADHPYASAMTDKAILFLDQEMHGPGLFQYYTARNSRSTDFDLDDTACASVALRQSNPLLARGCNITHFIENRNEDGLFYTWVGRQPVANSVDSVVNANVVYYLGDRDETKSACQYLVDTVESGHESNSYRYYLDNMSLYYMVSRAYARGASSLGPAREAVVERVLQSSESDGSFGDELATACAVCSLINFDYGDVSRLRQAARFLERQQRADGSWRRVAMFHGSNIYFGSEELTTALCLEALVRVVRTGPRQPNAC